jgi:quercetin dioxygenase-like cupin family protein
MATKVIAPNEGRTVMNGFVVFKLFGADTRGALTVVEHVLEPGMLGAPMHTHRNEDEYSYVLKGEMTALIGDELIHAPAGTLVCKPRDLPHTFWNQSSQQTRVLELIAPGGFETYFDELNAVVSVGGPPDVGRIIAIAQKYGVEMDFSSLMEISQTYDVWLGGVRPTEVVGAHDQRVGEPL